MSNEMAANRSKLKDFLASIATMQGDLSNITAPPFVLAEASTVELPQYWADHPHLFAAPAAAPDASERALRVLKWFLGSLRNQQYAGRGEDEGVKKPLNAFLGELFFGRWIDDGSSTRGADLGDNELGETRLVSEQVSHHPPITACYLYNARHGISAEGFTQQEITFSGSVSIKQKGYAVLRIEQHDEDYLIPVPNVKVKGILTGAPYPELHGEYALPASSGYVSRISFSGKSFFGTGQKNGFEATLVHRDRPTEVLYEVKGAWNGVSTITDVRSGEVVEEFDVNKLGSAPLHVDELAEQDPWESRRAWQGVTSALRRGDMKGTSDAKAVVEEGQRQMRKDEEAKGTAWRPIFFKKVERDPVFDELVKGESGSFTVDAEHGGIWKVDREAVERVKKPYHGDLRPDNTRVEGGAVKQEEAPKKEDEKKGTIATEEKAPKTVEMPIRSKPVTASQESQKPFTNGNAQEPSKESAEKPPAEIPTSAPQEPTDAQVEAYLRAKTRSA